MWEIQLMIRIDQKERQMCLVMMVKFERVMWQSVRQGHTFKEKNNESCIAVSIMTESLWCPTPILLQPVVCKCQMQF